METPPAAPSNDAPPPEPSPLAAPKPDGVVSVDGAAAAAAGVEQPAGEARPEGERARGPDGKFLPKEGAVPNVTPPEPAPPKRWKLGDTEFESPDELAKAAERIRLEREEAGAYRKYVEEAHQRDVRAASIMKRLAQDPWSVLQEAGFSPAELAVQRVRQELEAAKKYEGMSPEQVQWVQRAEAAEARAQQLEQERAQEKQAAETKAVEMYKRTRAEHYIGVINKAIEVSGLPPTGEVQQRMVAEMKRALKYRYNIPPELLGQKVREDIEKEHSSWDTEERFSADAYVKRFPKRAEAIRAAVVASLQAAPPATQAPRPQAPVASRELLPKAQQARGSGPLTPDEFDKILRQRVRS